MSVFDFYSAYYDLLYREKDYASESRYVEQLLRESGLEPETASVLELGCGTGEHALNLASAGFSIHGIDQSEKMVHRAREKKAAAGSDIAGRLRFDAGDVGTYSAGKTFDAAVSLFHVTSYQTANDQLNAMFRNAAAHLRDGGIFLFDFWYGPAVLTDLPHRRVKSLEDEKISLERVAEPVMHYNENVVDVNYLVRVVEKATGKSSEIRELHRMRYLFYPEMEALTSAHGFSIDRAYEWMTREPLSQKSWNGVMVCTKRTTR